MIENVKVYKDQNIVDLALQEYGSIEGLVAFAERNGLALDEDPAIDAVLEIETAEVVNNDVRQFYKKQNYIVATGRESGGDGIWDDTWDDSWE
jgi:hypothetical protein